jgi:hypothetical protein
MIIFRTKKNDNDMTMVFTVLVIIDVRIMTTIIRQPKKLLSILGSAISGSHGVSRSDQPGVKPGGTLSDLRIQAAKNRA